MPILRDEDVGVFVCPNADIYDIVEYPLDKPPPAAQFCGKCGEAYIKRCAGQGCTDRVYHPSDVYKNVHSTCGTKIPWAEARNRTIDAGPGFHSKLVGTGSYMGGPFTRLEPKWEMTPQERQDLINPPSGRLPISHKPELVVTNVDLQKIEPANMNRYLLFAEKVAAEVIDKPPRRVARAVLKFFRDRGEVVGRGADKGLEDAATLVVKAVILAIVLAILGYFGWLVFFKGLIPGL
jgi:hypothetical protein